MFIARAAGAAGVDLGDAMSAGFTDIGDVWQEAQDAINRLASKDMIPSGGEFRPDAAITRAEMATFLVGLLVKAAPNVTKDSSGKILLGTGTGAEADDHFADARAALPRALACSAAVGDGRAVADLPPTHRITRLLATTQL